VLDAAKDFMLDRLDDALEPLARGLGGKALWDEMKENAERASEPASGGDPGGGAALVAELLADLVAGDPDLEVHVVGHSAGAIFHGPLLQRLIGRGVSVASLTLWAPACTLDFFRTHYLPAIRSGQVDRFALFTLTDEAERDDNCKRIYNKSLLYLVSDAFEERPRIPILRPEGTPLLGMERALDEATDVKKLFSEKRADWVRAPNTRPQGGRDASRATSHGAFDDDRATVAATLARITMRRTSRESRLDFHHSSAALSDRRVAFARESGAPGR
jgi:hypothetical protein